MSQNNSIALSRLELKRDLQEFETQGGMPLTSLANILTREESTIPNDQIRAILQEADVNGDRRINYAEFESLVLNQPSNVLSRSIMTHVSRHVARIVVPKSIAYEEEYIEHFNCKPPPLFIPLVSAAIVGVFVVYAVLLAQADTPVSWIGGVATYSPLIFCPSRRYEAWRFITYALMHAGYQHIVTNLILQLLIGIPLEWVHKWRVIPIYIGGIIAGVHVLHVPRSLGQSVFDNGIALVGASGGVYALIGAHFGNMLMNWSEMVKGWDDYPPLGFMCSPFFQLPLFLVLVIGDTGIAVLRRWWPALVGGGDSAPVGIAAHIGGLIAGFLLGAAFVKDFKTEAWERVVFYVVLLLYLALTLAAVLWNTFYPNYPITDWSSCCSPCSIKYS